MSSSLPSSPLSPTPRLQRASTDFIVASHNSSCSNSNTTSLAPLLSCSTPSSPSSSPSSLSSCSSTVLDSSSSNQRPPAIWRCWYGCGKEYKKSSGRSIRRHITCCFRQHWPGGEMLTEEAVSALINSQQESGQLVTGLRKWKMRRSRRNADDLPEAEVWTCPFGCGKRYRSTSSRSIQNHANGCDNRNDDGVGGVDVKRVKTELDEESRHGRQREDDPETVIRTAEAKREDRGSGSSTDEKAESAQWIRGRTRSGSDIGDHGQSFSSSSSDGVFPLSSPPSPIGTFSDPSSLGDTCSPFSASSLTSLASTFHEWELASHGEPALVAQPLQEVELLSLQQSYDDTLARQKLQVAAELQQLLLDIYARYGTRHPVFDHPGMASCLTWLLTQGAGRAAAEWPSTTPPTQAGSCLSSPALSTTD